MHTKYGKVYIWEEQKQMKITFTNTNKFQKVSLTNTMMPSIFF